MDEHHDKEPPRDRAPLLLWIVLGMFLAADVIMALELLQGRNYGL